jgi:SAM-dependent MidA family methyltransferase
MAPLAAEGLLDFAVFDATNPQSPYLLRSQKTLTSEDLANPLIVIANYFLDSLPQDCFTTRGGLLYESMVQMSGEPGQAALMRYEQRPAATPYYHDAELDSILDTCRIGDEGVILFQ